MSAATESLVLPELQDALLDEQTLEQLARDLESFAQVDEVLLKGAPTARAGEGSIPLAEALDALRQRRVLGVQIRYRFQGTLWWDTLLRTPHGVRLVRITPPTAGSLPSTSPGPSCPR
jgi:hypothetical protein